MGEPIQTEGVVFISTNNEVAHLGSVLLIHIIQINCVY